MLRSSMLAVALAVAAVAAAACGTTAAETPAAAGEPGGDTEGGESAPPRLLDDAEAARTETQAMQTHVQASGLLSRCEQEGDRAACEQAEDLFRVAADTWRALVEGRPDEAGNASWSFMLSQALLHAGSYARAAEAAATYVASGAEEWRAQAARIGVSASERAIEAEVLPVREEPPEAQGQPPEVEPAELPGHVLRLFDARASFVEVVGEAEPETARRYVLANAELLFRYGHWERAQAALREVFTAGCTGDGAWDGAAAAWRLLREMSLRLGRLDAVRLLGEEVTSLGCDFGEPDAPVCGADSDHPQCLARADAVSWRLSGGTRFMQRAERAGGDERRRWARRAGEAFLAALNAEGELDARGRVAALDEAAGAFRLAGDAERAAEVDRRIVRDVDPATLDEADRPFAVVTVASALARRLEEAILAERHAEVV